MTWERMFIRLQVVAVSLVFLLGAIWGPQRVVAVLLGAGPPVSGELVPRQIPYRGYLARDGVAVTDNALPLTFTLRYQLNDGGVGVWSESRPVPIVNGNFGVDLGDSVDAGLPAEVFQQPFVELLVAVDGNTLVGSQRLLTVPYASTAGRALSAEGPLAAELGRIESRTTALRRDLADEAEVEVYGMDPSPAGLGTVDTQIVRFLNVNRSVGSAITRSTSTANGDVFTINEPGVYAISASVAGPPTGSQILGLSLNATASERQAAIWTLPLSKKLASVIQSAPNGWRQYPAVSGVFRLRAGDQVRVHVGDSSACDVSQVCGASQGLLNWARITRLYSTP